MAAWLVPALKAVLPHVGNIISAAAPVFTRRQAGSENDQQVLQQQISELQSAATHNAEHVKELAAQLQSALAAIEEAAAIADERLRRMQRLAMVSSGVAIAASVSAIVLVLLLSW